MLRHEHAVSRGGQERLGPQQMNPGVALADDDGERRIHLFRWRQVKSGAETHFGFCQQHGLSTGAVDVVAELWVGAFL